MAHAPIAAVRWDPAQYARYADARLRPGFELMDRLPALPAGAVVDLGCGAGEHVIALAARMPDRRVIGVDLSPEMLARARAAAPDLDWRLSDIGDWAPAPDTPVALLFSNAALQWLEDHATLLPRLFAHVAPGGVFALQMPSNLGSAAHEIARDLCREMGREDLVAALRSGATVLEATAYYDLLRAAGGMDVDVWETTYLHQLGAAGVTDWVKGTALRPVLTALAPDDAARFLETYDVRVRRAYPPRADGVTLYPQRRVFLVARRLA